MQCVFEHNWGWPRRRGGMDVQVCVVCGRERRSPIQFDGPFYKKAPQTDPAPVPLRFAERLRTAHASAS